MAVDCGDLLAYRVDARELAAEPLTARPIVACDPEGRHCLRATDLRTIERSTDGGGTWVVEFRDEGNRMQLTGSMATADGDVTLLAGFGVGVRAWRGERPDP